jgi:hypothetical protein
MSEGFFFPYRRTPIRYAPMVAPSRYDETTPVSYDSRRHTVDCVIATGSPLRCQFGMRVMRISDRAIDLSLLDAGCVRLLLNHDSSRVVGRCVGVWIEDRELYGTLRFDRTIEGQHAEDQVARGALTGISLGSTIQRLRDQDGNLVSVDVLNENDPFNVGSKVFTATRWKLIEVSLTLCGRDPEAGIL